MPPNLPQVVLEAWRFVAPAAVRTTVLPDGCRDLILRFPGAAAPETFVSPLHDVATTVASAAGDCYVGYRFHPAARCDIQALLAALPSARLDDPAAVLTVVADRVRLDAALAEALAVLSASAGVAEARRRLGVSERTLERLVAATGRPPAWWYGLARARRAARALADSAPLAALAAAAGYADQAHMSRDLRRRFGASPARLRAARDLPDLLAAPAYG